MTHPRARLHVLWFLALLAAALVPALPRAQEGGGSFVTPFPENDTYRVQVYGDSLAEGLLGGLIEGLSGEARVQVHRKHRKLGNMFRNDAEDESQAIETELAREPAHVAVIMFNPAWGFPWRQSYDRRRFPPGSEAWKDEFDRRRDEWKAAHGPRLDRLMRAFKRRNAAVYVVGLPILRRQEATDDAQALNELARERAVANGMRFIDVLATFADEGGVYTAHGPDLTGKSRQLRESDGVHFTQAGYRKLAHFVEREIKRDIALARSERSIPLAGTEAEQKRIRPQKVAAPAAATPPARPGAPAAPGSKQDRGPATVRGGPPAADPGGQSGDIRADNARVTLKTLNTQGREDTVVIDILRPSIPANVVQLVTRRESADKASQVGDPVMTEIGGGLTVISSVTPTTEAGAGDARRSAPTNSPYYRALVKGERLEPKPGRADEFPWPRPEALPQPPPRPEPVRAPAARPTAPEVPSKGAPARKPPSRG
jgi:hypothetical protein